MLWLLLLPLLWALEWAQGQGPEKLSQADSRVSPRGFWNTFGMYTLEVPASVTVQEGLCAIVPCTFFHSGLQHSTNEVFGYWYRDKYLLLLVATNDPSIEVDEEIRGRFYLVGDPQDNNCSLGISDAKRRDTGRYYFRIESRHVWYSYLDSQLSLQVTELAEAPVIDVPETLESGRLSNVTCAVPWACKQGTPPIFSWNSSSPTVLDPGARQAPVLPINPKPEDHGASLTCQVTFPGVGVMAERTVLLNVSYAPQNLTISVSRGASTGSQILANGSSLEIEEGESLNLTCTVTHSHPPAMLLWVWGDPALGSSQPSSQETLRLTGAQAGDSGEYVCRSQHPLGTQDASIVLTVKSPLQLLGPSCSWGAEGLHCTCASRAWPAPALQWRLGEELLDGDIGNPSVTITSSSEGLWANSSLNLHEGLGPNLRLSCEARNVHGARSTPVLLLLGPEDWKGNPGEWTGMVQGAILGAGVTALLAASLCLIFFALKTYRKKSVKKAGVGNGAEPAVSSFFLGHLKSPYPRGSPEGTPPAVATPPNKTTPSNAATPPAEATPREEATPAEGAEPELHYASLSFGSLKPRAPQDQDSSNTVHRGQDPQGMTSAPRSSGDPQSHD